MSSARFEHPDLCCVFLGQHDGRDLYWCDQNDDQPTIVVRWGDEPAEFTASPRPFGFLTEALREGLVRAERAGLAIPPRTEVEFIGARAWAIVDWTRYEVPPPIAREIARLWARPSST